MISSASPLTVPETGYDELVRNQQPYVKWVRKWRRLAFHGNGGPARRIGKRKIRFVEKGPTRIYRLVFCEMRLIETLWLDLSMFYREGEEEEEEEMLLAINSQAPWFLVYRTAKTIE